MRRRLCRLRSHMVHEDIEEAQPTADALNAAHGAMADLVAAAAKMADLATHFDS